MSRKVCFIGSRLNVLNHIGDFPDLKLVKIFVQEETLLARELPTQAYANNIPTRFFSLKDKKAVFAEILSLDFDILISNGCPFILPVSEMRKAGQLFVNIHPTLLPELKGKTPLSGVFLTHQKAIGATMHYMDDGIDTGATIYQEKIDLTSDIDQGLVYKISFDAESTAFLRGMKILQENNYKFAGTKQRTEGSYFNRTLELQTVDVGSDKTDTIIDKVKSFGIKGQGTHFVIEGKQYLVYAAEKIINDYLLATYSNVLPGRVVFYYDDKIVLRTVDGMVKIMDYEIMTEGLKN